MAQIMNLTELTAIHVLQFAHCIHLTTVMEYLNTSGEGGVLTLGKDSRGGE